jgi:hypothetical protein
VGIERGKGNEPSSEPRGNRVSDAAVVKKSIRMPDGAIVKKSVRMSDGTVVRVSVRMSDGSILKKSARMPYADVFKNYLIDVPNEGIRKQRRKQRFTPLSKRLPLTSENTSQNRAYYRFLVEAPICDHGLESKSALENHIYSPEPSFRVVSEEKPTEAANLSITLVPTKNWSFNSRKNYERGSDNDFDAPASDGPS